MRLLALVGIAAGLIACAASCIEPWRLQERKFPCRAAEDCVEGYFCHPQDFVCVPDGTAVVDAGTVTATATAGDAGVSAKDAALVDATVTATTVDAGMLPGLGDRCTGPCADGTCVDGVCCEAVCNGPCQRCDLTPGRCLPVTDGVDPDGDCTGNYDCGGLLFGLDGAACLACPAGPAPGGTCDGAAGCRPAGCQCDRPGPSVSRCRSASCLRQAACPAGAPVARFDESAELCAVGEACGDMVAGCCSDRGACCPAPMCDDTDPLCRQ